MSTGILYTLTAISFVLTFCALLWVTYHDRGDE